MQSVLMNGVGLMDILINLLGQIDTSEMGKGASASNERIVHRYGPPIQMKICIKTKTLQMVRSNRYYNNWATQIGSLEWECIIALYFGALSLSLSLFFVLSQDEPYTHLIISFNGGAICTVKSGPIMTMAAANYDRMSDKLRCGTGPIWSYIYAAMAVEKTNKAPTNQLSNHCVGSLTRLIRLHLVRFTIHLWSVTIKANLSSRSFARARARNLEMFIVIFLTISAISVDILIPLFLNEYDRCCDRLLLIVPTT